MHISPDDKRLQYCGRIDFDNPKAPVLVYAASFVQIRFTGTQISVTLENKRAYWSSRMGYILDGKQGQFLLTSDPGANFQDLLQQRRFQAAVKLLEETDLSIEDISLDVGYENQSYFFRQFKKRFGMTPRSYRITHQK